MMPALLGHSLFSFLLFLPVVPPDSNKCWSCKEVGKPHVCGCKVTQGMALTSDFKQVLMIWLVPVGQATLGRSPRQGWASRATEGWLLELQRAAISVTASCSCRSTMNCLWGGSLPAFLGLFCICNAYLIKYILICRITKIVLKQLI